jgi:hypothetical protein
MIDGRFFDAGIYKADPVPMALEGGTVYEAQRTGQPIGLFTVKNVLQQQQTKAWIAEGEWEAAGAAPKKPTALQAESKPREEEDRPPTLRRPSKASSESKPAEAKPAETKPAENKTAGPTSTGSTTAGPAANPSANAGTAGTPSPGSSSPATTSNTTPSGAPGAPASGSAPASAPEEQDPNAPRLRRGIPPKTSPAAVSKKSVGPATQKATTAAASKSITTAKSALPQTPTVAKPTVQLIPAISDAGGPEPRPYTYEMKPEEEQAFRKKMLALATAEIAKEAKQFEPVEEPTGTSARKARPRAKPLSPTFSDVSLHVFDVATNNEPIIVLTAKSTPAPQPGKDAGEPGEYYVTLVARSDYNNELRKLFSAVTDDKHLDVTPRMELIDAADADGDGRAELLFREVSDAGNAYVVYRVTADQLWALFEGTPSGK